MKRPPYISILSATLNNVDTIERALESVSRQCFKSFEHVVVDGGSRDGTLEVIGQYENKYNLTWISEPDHGISDALNKGLRLSSGRYIIVIQADDQLYKQMTNF
jgi:glycosyltransferase involved in cell wall biosynthesis